MDNGEASAVSNRLSERIVGASVSPLVPDNGDVYVFIVGEAPGPRGADKSGVPFFGDAAGEHLYKMLHKLGAVILPSECNNLKWSGSEFASHKLRPIAHGVALGNAYDRCPSDDGIRFRTPSRKELESSFNVERLRNEVAQLQLRGLRGVVTLGRVATRTMEVVLSSTSFSALHRLSVPHPSAQGLLSMAPNRGRGAIMLELKAEWEARCRDAVLAAGWHSADD